MQADNVTLGPMGEFSFQTQQFILNTGEVRLVGLLEARMSEIRVKIFGAGSIGNHLAHASRRLGHEVVICDIDPSALERTRNEIFPSRYGAWDDGIELCNVSDAPVGPYDLIIVGTPPDSHISVAMSALEEAPKAMLIEKPVCGPALEQAQALIEKANQQGTRMFVGYDHVVGKAAQKASELARNPVLGPLETLDVEFREHWGGIFRAHPWLDGPQDSYLGYYERGGGASGEHSHAINLWQHFASELGAGRIVEVCAVMDMVNDGQVSYDKLCCMQFKTENGLVGRCVQDVVTQPHRKWSRMQFENGFVEWQCNVEGGGDRIIHGNVNDETMNVDIAKTRPDDFVQELEHLHDCLQRKVASPISLEKGLDTMLVIAAAHLSHESGKTIFIDYDKGYTTEALVRSN